MDRTPTWLTALQAALIGVVAGLAVHAILSIVVLQAGDGAPAHSGPKECRKASPSRDSVTPRVEGPAVSHLHWTIVGVRAAYPTVSVS